MSQLNLFATKTDDAATWLPNRNAALERLAAFAASAGTAYARSRNFDLGPHQRHNVSCLSPWIRHRALDEREVLARVLERHSQNASEKFVQEVFWRGYFKGNLEQHPNVWRNFCRDLESLNPDLNGSKTELQDRYATAIEGRTGIACFDAWAQELVSTNYLHNHNHTNSMAVGVAGVALLNEFEGAEQWLVLAQKNMARVLEYLPPDGASPEGVGYWSGSASSLVKYIMAVEPVYGVDYARSSPYLKNTAKYRLHASLPGYEENVDYADSPRQDYHGPGFILTFLTCNTE